MTESLKLKQINKHLKLAVELHHHRQMTGRHTPRNLRSLQKTSDNYLVLSGICFNKASVSTLIVSTQQLE